MTTTETPAAQLRAAAADLREFDDVMTPAVGAALAKMLDKFAWMGEMDADLLHRVGCPEAIAVARAILGEPERAVRPDSWECPKCHDLFERAGFDHEPCAQLGETP